MLLLGSGGPWAKVNHIYPTRLGVAAVINHRAPVRLNLWGLFIAEHVTSVGRAMARGIVHIASLTHYLIGA